MTVLEKHAMVEDIVKMASMTIHANALVDMLAKTAKVSDSHELEVK